MSDFSVDDDEASIKVFADLSLAVGDLTSELKKARLKEQARLASLPINIPFSRMSQPAGATDIQDFGGPQPGREWIVRLLIAIASPIGANAAVVTWYRGQIMPGPAAGQLPATMAFWQFSSVPGFQNFTSDVIKVRANERLIAGLTGVPGSSSIALSVVVNDQPSFGQGLPVAVE